MVDLDAEILATVGRVEQSHLNWMMGMGVSSSAIARLGKTQEPFGIGRVEFVGSDYWQPHDGPAAIGSIVQPVYEDGQIIDLIAWRSLKPRDWRWRVGEAWALGADSLHGDPWTGFASIRLHSTPLAWLAAGGEGLTILNWQSAALRALSNFEEIICADSTAADRLHQILCRPARLPKITTRIKQRVA